MTAGDSSVEVVLPLHGPLPWIRPCLESLGTQSRQPDLVTLVDDRIEDRAAVEALAETSLRSPFRILESAGPGISSALNTAIDTAEGMYLLRMDADDVAMPDRIARQLTALEAGRDALGFCGSSVRLIDAAGRALAIERYPETFDDISACLFRRTSFCHPSVCFETRRIGELRYRSMLDGAEDLDLFLRLIESGCRPINLPDYLLAYRVHSDQVSYAGRARQTAVQELVWRAARARARCGADPLEGDPGLVQAFIAWRLEQPGFAAARQALTALRYASTSLRGGRPRAAAGSVASALRLLARDGAAPGRAIRMWREGLARLQFEASPFSALNT
jgi:hypothetical protein